MNNAFLATLALTSALWAVEEPLVTSTLRFPEGDALTGNPSGLDSDGNLQWSSQLFSAEDARFKVPALDSISLQTLVKPKPPAETQAILTFQSHIDQSTDTLSGELLGFDDESVKLRTWYAGEISLKRSMLDFVEVDSSARPLISGAGRMSDWQTIGDPKSWNIEKNILTSVNRGSVARELPNLPDLVQLSFDLSFEYTPYLRLFFFADSGDELVPRTGYSISIQRGPMQFIKREDNRKMPLQAEPFGNRHDFMNDDASHIDLYLDRQEGLMKLYIDNTLVCSATDPDPLMGDNWWHLSTLQERDHTISNFTLRSWNGELPEKKDYLAFREPLSGEGEEIELQNGDTIIGKANAIQDGKLAIETEFLPVQVPISRLKSFQITNDENREEPRIYREDVRCYFHDGSHVTLRLSDINATTISGYSQVFGDLTFDLRAFSHINFNPYDEEARLRRGDVF